MFGSLNSMPFKAFYGSAGTLLMFLHFLFCSCFGKKDFIYFYQKSVYNSLFEVPPGSHDRTGTGNKLQIAPLNVCVFYIVWVLEPQNYWHILEISANKHELFVRTLFLLQNIYNVHISFFSVTKKNIFTPNDKTELIIQYVNPRKTWTSFLQFFA